MTSTIEDSDEMNQYFFDSITSKIDPSQQRIIIPEHYGEIEKILNLKFNLTYTQFGLEKQYHKVRNSDTKGVYTDKFQINFSIFQPKIIPSHRKIATIWFIHGVIDNSTGFFPLGNILGVFYRVVFLDLLGLGKSSKPLNFPWSLEIHSKIYLNLINKITKNNKWNNKNYIIGHDWGGGIVQLMATKDHSFAGVGLINTIAINNYWVTQIGSLVTLAKVKFDDPMFKILALSFVGNYTALKKTMHSKTEKYLNQNTLQTFEIDFIDSEAYENPKKTPFNTEIKYWNIRCLAEQAANLLGKGQLLPKSKTNPKGLNFILFKTPMLILGSDGDDMMPLQTVIKLKWILEKVVQFQKSEKIKSQLSIRTGIIYDSGHFSPSDQPEQIAHHIIDFIDNISGNFSKSVDYLGIGILQRGDFKEMMYESKRFKIK